MSNFLTTRSSQQYRTKTEILTLRVGRDAKPYLFYSTDDNSLTVCTRPSYRLSSIVYTETQSTKNFEHSGSVLDYLFVMCDSIGCRTGLPLRWQYSHTAQLCGDGTLRLCQINIRRIVGHVNWIIWGRLIVVSTMRRMCHSLNRLLVPVCAIQAKETWPLRASATSIEDSVVHVVVSLVFHAQLVIVQYSVFC